MAAVQWARQSFSGVESLLAVLEPMLARAAQGGAELVAIAPGVGEALQAALGCPEAAPELQAEFEALGQRLAAAYGVTLALGPLALCTASGRQRLAYLFGPDGVVLGTQAQTHRSAAERAAGLAVATELAPVPTVLGPVGLVVGTDVSYPEVSRILCLQGARILVHQAALPRWSEALALSRLWREVQANQVFGVEAYSVGEGWRGRSAVHAPVEMAPGGTGWLARAPDEERPALVLAELDFALLRRLVAAYPIHGLRNVAQYRRYFPALYDSRATGESPRRAATAQEDVDGGRGVAVHEPPLQRPLATLLAPWLRRRSRPAPVYAALEGLAYPPARPVSLPWLRVAVVQFDINLTFSAADYARHVYGLVRQAVEGGAGLVVFPEYATLPLVGLVPGARRLAAMLAASSRQAPAEEKREGEGGSAYGPMALAFRLAALAARRVYRATFSTLAARFGVTLLAGSAIELGGDGRLYNVGYLFGPDGGELARQVKTHLVSSEVAMGYGTGEEISVVETPAGRLAFPVCMDHTYYETARIAVLSGADLLIDPSANNEYYNPYAQARGVWNRVQEVQAYGVLCSGVGRVAGSVFEGKSGVYAPLGMTPGGDGVVAEAHTVDREEIVFADLDYAALRAYRQQEPPEFNLALYRRYLPVAYGSVR